ncbi:MAG: type II toxin-antitoxin system VapC family toxin [Bacteroidia bacterium]
MNLLLDTHIFLWYIEDDSRLQSEKKDLIDAPISNRFISIASLWEIAIKIALKKLPTKYPLKDFEKILTQYDIQIIDIKLSHLLELENLILYSEHKDPFDRLIVSQAIKEDLFLITDDSQMKKYPVKILF